MTTLCVFRSSEFGAGKAGFMSAMNDGAVYDVDSDNSDCSYGNMYNVQNMATAVAKCLGQDEVEIGAYRTIDGVLEYVSLSEMDNTTHHVDNSCSHKSSFSINHEYSILILSSVPTTDNKRADITAPS